MRNCCGLFHGCMAVLVASGLLLGAAEAAEPAGLGRANATAVLKHLRALEQTPAVQAVMNRLEAAGSDRYWRGGPRQGYVIAVYNEPYRGQGGDANTLGIVLTRRGFKMGLCGVAVSEREIKPFHHAFADHWAVPLVGRGMSRWLSASTIDVKQIDQALGRVLRNEARPTLIRTTALGGRLSKLWYDHSL